MADVHRPGEDRVAASGGQFADRRVDGQQTGRTGGINCVRRSAQVEPVGQPGGREIRHQSDGRVRALRPEGGQELFPDIGELACGQTGHEFAECGQQLGDGAYPLVEPSHAGRQVTAPADDHPDPGPVRQSAGAARVLDGLGGGPQGEQLVRVGDGDRGGHDPEPGRVERRDVVDEPAPPAVEPVGHRRPVVGPRIVEGGRIPPRHRNVGGGVHTRDDVAPERADIPSPREDRAHPDDRHRLRDRRAHRNPSKLSTGPARNPT
nr:hypothetical protein [Actinoplanes couchii]